MNMTKTYGYLNLILSYKRSESHFQFPYPFDENISSNDAMY